jgi:hypothetical protein
MLPLFNEVDGILSPLWARDTIFLNDDLSLFRGWFLAALDCLLLRGVARVEKQPDLLALLEADEHNGRPSATTLYGSNSYRE